MSGTPRVRKVECPQGSFSLNGPGVWGRPPRSVLLRVCLPVPESPVDVLSPTSPRTLLYRAAFTPTPFPPTLEVTLGGPKTLRDPGTCDWCGGPLPPSDGTPPDRSASRPTHSPYPDETKTSVPDLQDIKGLVSSEEKGL